MSSSSEAYDVDAIVIGSGIGGSAAAVCLAHAGKKVLLLEKNKRIGGSCSYYEKKGFHVDMGTHMFCRAEKGPLGEVLRRVGVPQAIRFRRAIPGQVVGYDFNLNIPANPLRLPLVLLQAIQQAQVPAREIPQVLRLFYQMLRMSEREVEALNRVSIRDFLLRHTSNPHVYIIFNFLLGLYFILSPQDISAGEAIWCFQRYVRDHAMSYPVGGTSAIPEAYLRIARRYGARVQTRAAVSKIIIEQGRAAGVLTADGQIHRAPVVISTSSLRDSLRLVGPGHFSPAFSQRVADIKGSLIAVQAKIALRRPLLNSAWIVGGTPLRFPPGQPTIASFDQGYASVSQGMIGHSVPVYCPVPTFFDPSLAPAGCQLLTACALAPTLDIPLKDQEALWIESMMQALYQMIPGLREEKPIFCDTFGMQFIAHWIGKEGGAAVTTGQAVGQVGADRPQVRSELPGLYFAGDCAGGRGVGTELAATSGMECSDAVLNDWPALQGTAAPQLRLVQAVH